jgi:uncharacterized membrane protein YhaH (DUF805 family)
VFEQQIASKQEALAACRTRSDSPSRKEEEKPTWPILAFTLSSPCPFAAALRMRLKPMRVFLHGPWFSTAKAAAFLRRLPALLSSFEGRIGRREFWAGSIVLAVVLYLAERWLHHALPLRAPGIMVLLAALAIYPFGALAAKRAADRGHDARWGLILVLLSVAAGMAARLAAGTGFAFAASMASLLVWLHALVTLGLMPGVVAHVSRASRIPSGRLSSGDLGAARRD